MSTHLEWFSLKFSYMRYPLLMLHTGKWQLRSLMERYVYEPGAHKKENSRSRKWQQLSLMFKSDHMLDSVLKLECVLSITSTTTYRGHDPSPYQSLLQYPKTFMMLSKSSLLSVNSLVDPIYATRVIIPLVAGSNYIHDIATKTKHCFSIV